ncbi:MAG: Holliday junction branch migration protein RuvA [Zavarzinella sp.]
MISKITGVLQRVLDEEARLQVGAFEYQILIPEFIRRQIQTRCSEDFTFYTIHYLEGGSNSNRFIPRLVGFLTEMELEFFELFCTVDKVGTKKALKAMSRPIHEIAEAIQRQDAKWLTTMPGVGKTSAEQIIATLRNKVTRYAMSNRPRTEAGGSGVDPNLMDDVYQGLLALGLSPLDARDRLDALVQRNDPFTTVDEAIMKIFKKID